MRSFFESSSPVQVIFMRFMWFFEQLVGDEASSARRILGNGCRDISSLSSL
jgi:hypothetical protein